MEAPVSGMICIRPTAPRGLTASGSKRLSARTIAQIIARSTLNPPVGSHFGTGNRAAERCRPSFFLRDLRRADFCRRQVQLGRKVGDAGGDLRSGADGKQRKLLLGQLALTDIGQCYRPLCRRERHQQRIAAALQPGLGPVEGHRLAGHRLGDQAIEIVAGRGGDAQEALHQLRPSDHQVGAGGPESPGGDVLARGAGIVGEAGELLGRHLVAPQPPGGEPGRPVHARLRGAAAGGGHRCLAQGLIFVLGGEQAAGDAPPSEIAVRRLEVVLACRIVQPSQRRVGAVASHDGQLVGPGLGPGVARGIALGGHRRTRIVAAARHRRCQCRTRRRASLACQLVDARGLRMIGVGLEPMGQLVEGRGVGGRMQVALRQRMAHQQPVVEARHQPIGLLEAAVLLQRENRSILRHVGSAEPGGGTIVEPGVHVRIGGEPSEPDARFLGHRHAGPQAGCDDRCRKKKGAAQWCSGTVLCHRDFFAGLIVFSGSGVGRLHLPSTSDPPFRECRCGVQCRWGLPSSVSQASRVSRSRQANRLFSGWRSR